MVENSLEYRRPVAISGTKGGKVVGGGGVSEQKDSFAIKKL